MHRDLLMMHGLGKQRALANALMTAGKLAEAEAGLRSIIADSLASPDRDERYLSQLEGDLATVLQQQARYEEAESFYRSASKRLERGSGSEIDSIFTSMNLGALLASQGRYGEADPLLRKAIAGARTLGLNGWEIGLSAQLGLAYILFAQYKNEELSSLLRSIEAEINRKNYGGSAYDFRLRRLQCLEAKKCVVGGAELRAEVDEAIRRSLPKPSGQS